ncbi:hypothetical protein [Micromonospora sp. WMMD1155]|uniref:hypothetical protein n=1 Tax=Micromonospora sp. WMMD1155 TaxID=3016094 RepID=UPI00249AE55A|nr:hypothetical protein [Micromonospora sp. WMMD1155]WFE51245.1 hypothetical protein O7617_13310 [Micromonospora sp. WMMD1155]
MLTRRRRDKAAGKITPGSGRALKPFRGWQVLSRALFYLPADSSGAGSVREHYAVDVPYWQRVATSDGKGKAHLYRNSRHHAVSTLPAVFPIEGGSIEVISSAFGLRRCHFIPEDGPERQLIPDQRSAEGRRAKLHRDHRMLSRTISVLSLLVLSASALLLIPQLLEIAMRIPPVVERFGTFSSPIQLPLVANIALGLGAATASVERATRLRYTWLDTIAQ